ncbi:MAG: indole-3-glycerol phosphate synthase TrpC [Planctomycetota bacterium]|jgi:indole-3-glycerol phosphate synthase
MAETILQEILRTKFEEVAAAKSAHSLEEIRSRARDAPKARPFRSAVLGGGARPRAASEGAWFGSAAGVGLIAEVKRKSPSAGVIVANYDPCIIARRYEEIGARAISVLTDASYFGGNLADLSRVRLAVGLPLLRKDFVVDEYQVFEARAAGADAVLLIAEAIDIGQIESFLEASITLGLMALIECHERGKLEAVVSRLGTQGEGFLLGVNNRDLARQVTDLSVTESLGAILPDDVPFVSESGISSAADVERVARAGARAVLVGEGLLRREAV